MTSIGCLRRISTLLLIAILCAGVLLFGLRRFSAFGEDRSDFPDGFDAVQAAPSSHKVIYENAFLRVLQVTLPPAGSSEPMHHHRWPSLFLGYDTGGRTAHIRYHRPGGKVVDQPSSATPVHAGVWTAEWLAPEPMHSIEVVEDEAPGPGAPPGFLRVEVKCAEK